MLSRHQIEIDNRNVFYWQRNPDAKNVILFVHGFKGNHKGLTQLSEVFQEYRTILLDLPGYGISDEMPVKHTIENYARFIHRFIKTLNINDYELVGHSYGGSIAIVYAGLFPQKINHLILIAPAIPQNSLSQTLAEFQLNISNKLPHSWRKAWLASPFIEAVSALAVVRAVSQNRKLELMAANIRNSKEQRPKVITQCLKSFLNTPFLKYAIKISTPTYIIAGEADFLAPLKSQTYLAEKINLSKVDLMPEVGHLAPLERPGTVASMIKQFLGHNFERPTHVHVIPNQGVAIQPRHQKKIIQSSN